MIELLRNSKGDVLGVGDKRIRVNCNETDEAAVSRFCMERVSAVIASLDSFLLDTMNSGRAIYCNSMQPYEFTGYDVKEHNLPNDYFLLQRWQTVGKMLDDKFPKRATATVRL